MFLPYYDFYNYPTKEPQRGKTLLLLGTSSIGPVNTPIYCSNKSVAERIFGIDGSLLNAYKRAYDVDGTIDIYLMRISGEHATASLVARPVRETSDKVDDADIFAPEDDSFFDNLEDEEEEEDDEEEGEPDESLIGAGGTLDDEMLEIIKFKAISGGEIYNDTQIIFSEALNEDNELVETLAIVFPGETNLQPLHYQIDKYETVNELVRDINEDTRKGNSCVIASTKYHNYSTELLTRFNDTTNFTGGEDGLGLTKDELYLALDYSYSLLEGYYIDFVCPVEAKFDDVHPAAFYGKAIYGTSIYEEDRDYLSLQDSEAENRLVTFHGQLINFCKSQIGFGCMTHGIIGLNKIKDPTDIEKHEYAYIVRLLETSGFKTRYDLAEFSDGEWFDSGYYISVVAGEMYYEEGTEDEYYENMAVSYAAMLTSTSVTETTTNKAIPGAGRLRYEFPAGDLIELGNMGVVAPRNSVRHGIVVSNGVTASMPDSEMHSISNVRQIQLTISFLNEELDQYVGQPLRQLVDNGIVEKSVDDTLKSLKEDGILIDYDSNLVYDEEEGTAEITVELQAVLMVERVTATSTLTMS